MVDVSSPPSEQLAIALNPEGTMFATAGVDCKVWRPSLSLQTPNRPTHMPHTRTRTRFLIQPLPAPPSALKRTIYSPLPASRPRRPLLSLVRPSPMRASCWGQVRLWRFMDAKLLCEGEGHSASVRASLIWHAPP
eukprot:782208-Prymnesium_polylepis.1